jgi:hypothetical protein
LAHENVKESKAQAERTGKSEVYGVGGPDSEGTGSRSAVDVYGYLVA